MTEPEPQPSEEQELANAAYNWRKKVQADMLDALRSASITLSSAEWWFERYRRAYQREMITEAAAKAAKEQK